MANAQPLPDWYNKLPPEQPEQADAAASSVPDKRPMPDWYTPEPTADAATAAPDQGSVGANVAASLARVPGAILGVPHMVEHTVDWLGAQAANAAGSVVGQNPNLTGADLDKYNWMARVRPSSDTIDKHVFDTTGIEDYQPRTTGGRIGSAALTGGVAALADPATLIGAARSGVRALPAMLDAAKGALKTGVASGAAQGTQEIAPDTPGLAAIAALATHGGLGAAERAATTGGGVVADATRQVFSPSSQGTREAGRALGSVDNTLPALAQPDDAALGTARGDVASATGDIGAGLPAWLAGDNLRNILQKRVTGLQDARTAATAPIMAARDASTATVDTKPVLDLISNKLDVAAGAQADALAGARADLLRPAGSTPIFRTQADQLAASRQAINARINAATRSGDTASAAHLLDVRNTLDTQLAASVPQAGQYTQTFADLSKPLHPTQFGPVAKVLDRDQFNSRYIFPDERIPDLFLRSPAARSDINQLIDAHGGDRNAALGALQDHLAGKVEGALNPDGTLDQGAFDRVMAPYQKSLGGNLPMFFPKLAGKFANARAAQGTLDTMTAQRGLANAVSGGALRDGNGAITGQSFGKWMDANKATLAQTQSPGAVMRLQQIRSALQSPQGEMADALKSELLPTALGVATGGLEGGVLGSLMHRATHAAFSGLDAKRLEAFNAGIERATLDPDYAKAISGKMGSYRNLSPARSLVRAIYSTAVATSASSKMR